MGICDQMAFTLEGPVCLLADNRGVAELLAPKLAAWGLSVQIVKPSVTGSYELPTTVAGCISLCGLNVYEAPTSDLYLQENFTLFTAAAALGKQAVDKPSLFITVQDTGGSFGYETPAGDRFWRAGGPALVKTAAKEWFSTYAKAIDVESQSWDSAQIAETLFQEISCGGPELEIGITAAGMRLVVKTQVAPYTIENTAKKSQSLPASSNEVLLVSGGARGVTAACVVAYAQRVGGRVALFGRTALTPEPAFLQEVHSDAAIKAALAAQSSKPLAPKELGQQAAHIQACREIRHTLTAIQEAGAQALYVAVDIGDRASVQEGLRQVREAFGPITGFVHGAGVLADKRIHEKTLAQFSMVFHTKIKGFQHILEELASDPLHYLCCFSSVAGRFGNRGQCDYAMANDILTKACLEEQRRRGPACRVKAINWGPWDGGMVTPALRNAFQTQGISLIPLLEGAQAFLNETLTATAVDVVVGAAFDLGSAGHFPRQYAVTVNQHTTPLVGDHLIKGTPVVPVVQVCAWLRTIAQALMPNNPIELQRIKVLSGLKLSGEVYRKDGARFTIHVDKIADGFTFAVCDHKGQRPFYTAQCVVARQARPLPQDFALLDAVPWALDASRIYEKTLFHDGVLQVVHKMHVIDDQKGCEAMLKLHASDPQVAVLSALDGGIQLGLLFFLSAYGSGTSLPTSLGSLVVFQETGWPQDIVCRLKLEERQASFIRGHIGWFDSKGTCLAVAQDTVMHIVPSNFLR